MNQETGKRLASSSRTRSSSVVDGVDYPNADIYEEVRPPERLVFIHEAPRFRTSTGF
jgi:uncharacterized protein YndB with AHSA1/START domain